MSTSASGRRAEGRRQRSDGAATRAGILRTAASMATVHGLDGLTIGMLAGELGMSKSGLYAHFGSKEELQLATIDEAQRIFDVDVVEPAMRHPAGLDRLLALCDGFFDHLRGRTFPGGCFFVSAALEMGTRPGPVKAAIVAFQEGLSRLIAECAQAAISAGDLAADERPDFLAFELNGMIVAADAAFVLRDDPAVLDLASAVVRRRLRVADR